MLSHHETPLTEAEKKAHAKKAKEILQKHTLIPQDNNKDNDNDDEAFVIANINRSVVKEYSPSIRISSEVSDEILKDYFFNDKPLHTLSHNEESFKNYCYSHLPELKVCLDQLIERYFFLQNVPAGIIQKSEEFLNNNISLYKQLIRQMENIISNNNHQIMSLEKEKQVALGEIEKIKAKLITHLEEITRLCKIEGAINKRKSVTCLRSEEKESTSTKNLLLTDRITLFREIITTDGINSELDERLKSLENDLRDANNSRSEVEKLHENIKRKIALAEKDQSILQEHLENLLKKQKQTEFSLRQTSEQPSFDLNLAKKNKIEFIASQKIIATEKEKKIRLLRKKFNKRKDILPFKTGESSTHPETINLLEFHLKLSSEESELAIMQGEIEKLTKELNNSYFMMPEPLERERLKKDWMDYNKRKTAIDAKLLMLSQEMKEINGTLYDIDNKMLSLTERFEDTIQQYTDKIDVEYGKENIMLSPEEILNKNSDLKLIESKLKSSITSLEENIISCDKFIENFKKNNSISEENLKAYKNILEDMNGLLIDSQCQKIIDYINFISDLIYNCGYIKNNVSKEDEGTITQIMGMLGIFQLDLAAIENNINNQTYNQLLFFVFSEAILLNKFHGVYFNFCLFYMLDNQLKLLDERFSNQQLERLKEKIRPSLDYLTLLSTLFSMQEKVDSFFDFNIYNYAKQYPKHFIKLYYFLFPDENKKNDNEIDSVIAYDLIKSKNTLFVLAFTKFSFLAIECYEVLALQSVGMEASDYQLEAEKLKQYVRDILISCLRLGSHSVRQLLIDHYHDIKTAVALFLTTEETDKSFYAEMANICLKLLQENSLFLIRSEIDNEMLVLVCRKLYLHCQEDNVESKIIILSTLEQLAIENVLLALDFFFTTSLTYELALRFCQLFLKLNKDTEGIGKHLSLVETYFKSNDLYHYNEVQFAIYSCNKAKAIIDCAMLEKLIEKKYEPAITEAADLINKNLDNFQSNKVCVILGDYYLSKEHYSLELATKYMALSNDIGGLLKLANGILAEGQILLAIDFYIKAYQCSAAMRQHQIFIDKELAINYVEKIISLITQLENKISSEDYTRLLIDFANICYVNYLEDYVRIFKFVSNFYLVKELLVLIKPASFNNIVGLFDLKMLRKYYECAVKLKDEALALLIVSLLYARKIDDFSCMLPEGIFGLKEGQAFSLPLGNTDSLAFEANVFHQMLPNFSHDIQFVVCYQLFYYYTKMKKYEEKADLCRLGFFNALHFQFINLQFHETEGSNDQVYIKFLDEFLLKPPSELNKYYILDGKVISAEAAVRYFFDDKMMVNFVPQHRNVYLRSFLFYHLESKIIYNAPIIVIFYLKKIKHGLY